MSSASDVLGISGASDVSSGMGWRLSHLRVRRGEALEEWGDVCHSPLASRTSPTREGDCSDSAEPTFGHDSASRGEDAVQPPLDLGW